MSTYLDGIEGGKHNSDNAEATSTQKSFKVTLTFDGVVAKNPLMAAKVAANWCWDAKEFSFDVVSEETGDAFIVDLSEDDEDAVLPLK